MPFPSRAPTRSVNRRSFLAGSAALGVAAVSGCSTGRSADRLTFLVNHTNQEAELFQKVIDQFVRSHPRLGIRVQVQNIANGAQFYTKLRTVSVTHDLPDIWYARTLDTAFNVANDWQRDLTDRIRSEPSVDVSDMWPSQVRQMSIGDQQYSLPYDFSCYAIYYNKTMFEKAGIPRPDDDNWTWSDLFDLASSFGHRSGRRQDRWGFYFSLSDWLFDGIFRSNGGSLFNADGTQVTVGSQENIDTMHQFIKQLDNGNAPRSQTLGAAVDPFVSGLVAMAVNGSWASKQTRDQIGDRFDWDVLKLPKGTTGERAVATAGGAWGISTDSKNPDACWELISYLSARQQINTFISKPLRGTPGRQSSATDETRLASRDDQPPHSFGIFAEQIRKDSYPVTYPSFWAEFETIWNNRTSALNAGARPEDVLRQVQKDSAAAARRYLAESGK